MTDDGRHFDETHERTHTKAFRRIFGCILTFYFIFWSSEGMGEEGGRGGGGVGSASLKLTAFFLSNTS